VLLYAAEAVNSAAGTLLTVGLLFYMTRRFDWGARENFTVAACQGALYVLGALSAKRLSGRWKRIAALQALYAAMPAFAVAAGFFATVGWAVPTAAVVAVETGMMGASWPLLESLVSAAGDPDRLSKRLGWYNIVWATTGALALALSGSIIQHLPPWAFFGIVAAIHLSAGSAITLRRILRAGLVAQPAASARPPSDGGAAPSAGGSSERTLKLALWLSRIALPSTYVIIFSLAPALPTLHAVGQLPPALATVECSIWFVARAVAFVVLGSTSFWRRRPVLVLGASVTMLAGFLGTLAAGSSEGAGLGAALAGMALAQLLLGLSLGAIYACSLYFGMAVSKGSTEHGGYHEALIGFGQVLGPVVGVIAQWAHPGALWPVAAGISAVVVATIAVEAVAGARIAGGVAAMVGGGGGAAT
jgi:MFS family permease